MGRVGSGWTRGFDNFFIIIIKLGKKKYKY